MYTKIYPWYHLNYRKDLRSLSAFNARPTSPLLAAALGSLLESVIHTSSVMRFSLSRTHFERILLLLLFVMAFIMCTLYHFKKKMSRLLSAFPQNSQQHTTQNLFLRGNFALTFILFFGISLLKMQEKYDILYLENKTIGGVKMNNTIIMDHPLVRHKITLLRDESTGTKDFRILVSEIANLMCYEALRDIPTELVKVRTPITETMQPMLTGKKPSVRRYHHRIAGRIGHADYRIEAVDFLFFSRFPFQRKAAVSLRVIILLKLMSSIDSPTRIYSLPNLRKRKPSIVSISFIAFK